MKKIIFKTLITIFVLVIAFVLSANLKVSATTGDYFHISTNIGEDASTMANICFQSSNQKSYIEYTLASDTTYTDKVRKDPTFSLIDYQMEEGVMVSFDNPTYKAEVSLDNLTPGTKYMYHVTNGVSSSSNYYFTTATGTGNFTFSAMSDPQFYETASANTWYKCMQKAYEIENSLAFNVICGDLVERGVNYNHWDLAFACEELKNNFFVPTTGNHEYYTTTTKLIDYRFYSSMFNNPDNGAKSNPNSSYYFKYNNTLFIVIDSEYKESGTWSTQKEWFKDVVENNPSTFIIVAMHTSMYGSVNDQANASGSRDSTNSGVLRRAWLEVFDTYGVDLVLTGHDHVYLRSHNLYNNAVCQEAGKGTYYVTTGCAGSSLKYSETLCDLELNACKAKATCFGIVKVMGSNILYKTYNASGTVIDEFVINAKRSGETYSDFNKDTFIDEIKFTINNENRTIAGISWNKNGYGNVKNIVINSGTTKLYEHIINGDLITADYVKNLKEDTRYECVATITLINGEEVSKNIVIDTNINYGSISNLVKTDNETSYKFSWDQAIDTNYTSMVTAYINNVEVDNTRARNKIGNFTIEKSSLVKENEIKFVINNGEKDIVIYKETFIYDGYKEDPIITLTSIDSKIMSNETFQIEASVNEDYKLIYSSSDKNIATVSENGLVTPLKEGKVVITIKVADSEATEELTIDIEKFQEKDPDIEDPDNKDPDEDNDSINNDDVVDDNEKNGCNDTLSALLSIFTIFGLIIIKSRKH